MCFTPTPLRVQQNHNFITYLSSAANLIGFRFDNNNSPRPMPIMNCIDRNLQFKWSISIIWIVDVARICKCAINNY